MSFLFNVMEFIEFDIKKPLLSIRGQCKITYKHIRRKRNIFLTKEKMKWTHNWIHKTVQNNSY